MLEVLKHRTVRCCMARLCLQGFEFIEGFLLGSIPVAPTTNDEPT